MIESWIYEMVEFRIWEYITKHGKILHDGPWKCVYIGSGPRKYNSIAIDKRGYKSYVLLDDIDKSGMLSMDMNRVFGNVFESISLLVANELQSKAKWMQRALFFIEIYGRTTILSTSVSQKPLLETLIDLFVYRYISSDVMAVVRQLRHKLNVYHLKKCTMIASIWKPSDLTIVLDPFITRGMNVAFLTGSWGTPCIYLETYTPDIHITVFDVIDTLTNMYSMCNSDRCDIVIQSTIEPLQTTREFDIVVWNPPYWVLELYQVDSNYLQDSPQSTSHRPSFNSWLDSYVYQTAMNAQKKMKVGCKLIVVCPSSISIGYRFKSKLDVVNTDGLSLINGKYRIHDFNEQLKDTIVSVAGLNFVSQHTLRQFPRSTNYEMMLVFENRSM